MDALPFPKSLYEKAKTLDITSVGFYSCDENYLEVSFDYDNYSKEKHSGKEYLESREELRSDLEDFARGYYGCAETDSDGSPDTGYQVYYDLSDNTVEINEWHWEQVEHDPKEYTMEIKDYDEYDDDDDDDE